MTFIAKYRGVCGECRQGIEVGDECAYVEKVIIHADCPPSLDDIDAARPVCPRCFLLIPCGCDDQ